MKKDKTKNSEKMLPDINENAENDFSSAELAGELRQPIWAVVSFEQCVATNLTYVQAAEKIAELEKQGISGLCVVTDAVAERTVNRC